jgi:YVTN family beta-propeller protein
MTLAPHVRGLVCGGMVSVILASGVILPGTSASAAEGGTAQGLLLVANKGSRALSLVDPVAGKQIAAIAEDGVTGHEVIASPDGARAYVPIYGNAGVGRPGTDGQLIRVIDLAKREIVGTIDLGHGVRPHCPLFHPKNGLLYVTTELENEVSVVDPKTLKRVRSIPTGRPESHMLALSHDGRRGYTANVASGTVSVLDLDSNALVTVIDAAPRVQRISISPDDRWVVTADQTKFRLLVIDTQTNTVSGTIPLPGFAYGTAFTPDGKWLVVALPGNSQVGLVDFEKRALSRTIDVPKAPQAVLLRPDGAVAYVSCDSSSQVAAISMKPFALETLIDVGPGADGLAWAQPLKTR